jgi:CRISPR-associated protein Csd1
MILQSLHDLYDRLKDDPDYRIAPPGYSQQKVSFVVVLEPGGRLFEIEDVREYKDGKPRPKWVMVPGGAKKPGSGLNPSFLWDNTGYMLGYKKDDEKPERTKRTFLAFRQRHLKVEDEIGSDTFSTVCRFLENWEPKRAEEYPVLEEVATGFGVFRIRGEARYVHEDSKVKGWWNNRTITADDVLEGQCLVTGIVSPIARTHPPVKGVKGAQGTGAAIVGFNEPAYESYGKSQSFNAPVSQEAAFRYVTAINSLLEGPMSHKHRLSIGDATVLFWTERPTAVEDIFVPFASEGSISIEDEEVQDEALRQKLESFLRALREGRERYGDLAEDTNTPYFILGLSPNAARISVRFFHRGTLDELLDNLRRHFDDIRVIRQLGRGGRNSDPEFPPAWHLLRQTARESKDIPPILSGPLLRAIIAGASYPEGLFSSVIRRIHADSTINYARACVIKGYLVRNLKKEVRVSLDRERTDAPYRLGRLFAALEKTQLDALGHNIGATVRDRFYSSASATPRSVFPRLLRTYQHHLAKLEGGLKVNREKLVQEIVDNLDDFPAHLDLAGQGLFAIGYYHQMQDFYTSKGETN